MEEVNEEAKSPRSSRRSHQRKTRSATTRTNQDSATSFESLESSSKGDGSETKEDGNGPASPTRRIRRSHSGDKTHEGSSSRGQRPTRRVSRTKSSEGTDIGGSRTRSSTKQSTNPPSKDPDNDEERASSANGKSQREREDDEDKIITDKLARGHVHDDDGTTADDIAPATGGVLTEEALKTAPSRRKPPSYRRGVTRNKSGELDSMAKVGRQPSRRRLPSRSKSNDLDLVSDSAASDALEWGAQGEAIFEDLEPSTTTRQAPPRRRAPPRSKSNDLELVSDVAASDGFDWPGGGAAFEATDWPGGEATPFDTTDWGGATPFETTDSQPAKQAPTRRRAPPRSKSSDLEFISKPTAADSKRSAPAGVNRRALMRRQMASSRNIQGGSSRKLGQAAASRNSVVERRKSLSVSDHSDWVAFGANDKKETTSDDEIHDEVNNNPLGLKLSGKDTHHSSSRKNRVVKEAKEGKLAEQKDASDKEHRRKQAYSKAITASTHEGGNASQRKPASMRKIRKVPVSTDILSSSLTKLVQTTDTS